MLKFKMLAAVLLLGSPWVFAHREHHRSDQAPQVLSDSSKALLEQINANYLKDIKPVFQRTCFDCHSSKANLPWYQKIPGVRQWIQSDMDEAKEHLLMDSDFPFKSHATVAEDLKAIDEEIQDNEMPPFRYRLMHPGIAITPEEKQKIRAWVEQSLQALGTPAK